MPEAAAERTSIESGPRFGLGRYVRSAGILSISSIASLARAVITAKLLAVALGPSSVGLLAQLLNFAALVSVIVPLGLTTGVTKMVAENRASESQVNRVMFTSSVLALGSGLAATLLLAPFSVPISQALTGSPRYALLVLLIVGSFPLYNLSGVLAYVLQGLSAIGWLTRANVANAILALIVLVPLTLVYGLMGAITAVLLTSAVQAAVFCVALWQVYRLRAWGLAGAALNRPIARELLMYGGVILLGGVANWASLLAVRTITVRELGQYSNGLYQVVNGLSSQYLTIFMTWMAAYVFPRIVSERLEGKLGPLLNSGLRANLGIMVPIFVGSIALRDPLIRIFYSSSFVAAGPLVPVQVLGDFVRVFGWSFAVCLFAIGHTRGHLLVVAGQSVAWVVLAATLIPAWGLLAVPASYAISQLVYPLLGISLARHWAGTAPDRKSWLLIGFGLACLLGAAFMPLYAGVLLVPVMPVLVYLLNRLDMREAVEVQTK